MENKLYYGDNLEILRKYIPDNGVDLIYIDPPFNSKANYNMVFKEESVTKSVAQIKAFSDFWHWDEEAQKTYEKLINNPNMMTVLQNLGIAIDSSYMDRKEEVFLSQGHYVNLPFKEEDRLKMKEWVEVWR